MGVEWSGMQILGGADSVETTEETFPDGRKVVRKRRNPWVTGAVVTGVTGILMLYMDGGKGTISKSFGRVCVECSKKI
jgi:hypothetical protein